MNLGEPIARGRTAEIFALPRNRVLKLYMIDVGADTVANERKAQRWAQRQGLPVPRTGLAKHIEGRHGFVMEHIEGIDGMKFIMQNLGDFEEEARRLAELQVRVNGCRGGKLIDRRRLLLSRIQRCSRLAAFEKDQLAAILERLPQGDRLVHGDFHPGNVMRTPSGPVIIDWIDAGRGVPEADVARSLVLFGAPLVGSRPSEDTRDRFTQVYLEHYLLVSDVRLTNLEDWHLVTAAARLVEGAAAEDKELASQVRMALANRFQP